MASIVGNVVGISRHKDELIISDGRTVRRVTGFASYELEELPLRGPNGELPYAELEVDEYGDVISGRIQMGEETLYSK